MILKDHKRNLGIETSSNLSRQSSERGSPDASPAKGINASESGERSPLKTSLFAKFKKGPSSVTSDKSVSFSGKEIRIDLDKGLSKVKLLDD